MLVLNALNWSMESDLNSPPGRWACSYLESGSTGALTPAETISQSAYTRAAIDVTLDGSTGRLTTGVVREHGIDEEEDSVLSAASGLDLKADLLDFMPTAPATYKGMQVLSDSNAPVPAGARKVLTIGSDSAGRDVKAAFFESFQTVAAKVCKAAGFTASFDAYDYDLGEDIVWETDRTANDILSQLAAPFNATERFKIDLFLDAANMARFVERGLSSPPQATIDYERILSRKVRRSGYPAFNDVQVLGAAYRYVEPDLPPPGSVTVDIGEPSRDGKPYQISYRYSNWEFEANTAAFEPTVPGDIIVSDVTGTRYFDADGRETEHAQWTTYYFDVVRNPDDGTWKGTFPMIRDESLTEKSSYTGPHGELTGRTRERWVNDTSLYKKWDADASPPAVVTRGKASINGVYLRETEFNEYDAEGNLAHSLTKTYRAEEKNDDATNPTITLKGLLLEREVEQFLWHSAGRRWRLTVTRNYNRDGSLQQSSSHSEPEEEPARPPSALLYWYETSRGRIGTWWTRDPGVTFVPYGWTLVQPKQYRSASEQLKAGPDNAQLRFSFSVLGTKDACEYFRGKISQERKSKRYEMRLTTMPNLAFVEGMDLIVAGAPARWERSTGFIAARSMKHEENLLDMTTTCLAWIDP